jgi:hypothetical protein
VPEVSGVKQRAGAVAAGRRTECRRHVHFGADAASSGANEQLEGHDLASGTAPTVSMSCGRAA